VLGVLGTMFAPDHHRTAAEIVRVARPGATVGLASWTPDGFVGQTFRVITTHVPAPVGVPSPLRWGTEEHLVAFAALEPGGRDEPEAELADVARQWDRHGDGGAVLLPAAYRQTVIRLR
jgi:hypothetical protein